MGSWRNLNSSNIASGSASWPGDMLRVSASWIPRSRVALDHALLGKAIDTKFLKNATTQVSWVIMATCKVLKKVVVGTEKIPKMWFRVFSPDLWGFLPDLWVFLPEFFLVIFDIFSNHDF